MCWLTKSQTADLLSLSPHTLRRYRERGTWLEGIHFIKLNQNTVRYNEKLILDWAAHRNNPSAHQRAIERYLSSLDEIEATKTSQKRKRSNQRTG
jgi:hypothetical protein